MQFTDLKRRNPRLLTLYEESAALLHAGATPEMTLGRMERRITAAIQPMDRDEVRKRLERWVEVVKDNDQHRNRRRES